MASSMKAMKVAKAAPAMKAAKAAPAVKQIFVKVYDHQGIVTKITLDDLEATDTIGLVKALIQCEYTDQEDRYLIFAGRPLEEHDRTLSDYNIKHKSILKWVCAEH